MGGIINYSAKRVVGRWRSSGARLHGMQEVRGSIPLRSTNCPLLHNADSHNADWHYAGLRNRPGSR